MASASRVGPAVKRWVKARTANSRRGSPVKRSTGHTHTRTPTENNTPDTDTHAHDTSNTPNPKIGPSCEARGESDARELT